MGFFRERGGGQIFSMQSAHAFLCFVAAFLVFCTPMETPLTYSQKDDGYFDFLVFLATIRSLSTFPIDKVFDEHVEHRAKRGILVVALRPTIFVYRNIGSGFTRGDEFHVVHSCLKDRQNSSDLLIAFRAKVCPGCPDR